MSQHAWCSPRLAATAFFMVAALAAAACDEPLSNIAGPSPNLQPTLSSIRTEIFESADQAGRVACLSCHTDQGRTPAGNLNLRADLHAALVGIGSRQKAGAVLVVPGDPDASYLVQKLEGTPGIVGVRMPRNIPPYLTDGQMLVIRRWIEIGAPNN